MKRMLSVVILTHNSEKTLASALDSVAFSDDIVVVDDGSTDATAAIVARYPAARLISRPLADDFAAQRNFGASRTKHGWVLFLDHDEVVPPELRKEIEDAVRHPVKNGYLFRRHDVLWGQTVRHGEIGTVRLLRLADKTKGIWVRPVHEVWQIEGPVGSFRTPLLHYPHPTVMEFLAEINRYSTSNARHLYSAHVPIPAWQIVAYPAAKFLQNYVLRQGFRDGTRGAIVALLMSLHSFLTRAKGWLLWHPPVTPVR